MASTVLIPRGHGTTLCVTRLIAVPRNLITLTALYRRLCTSFLVSERRMASFAMWSVDGSLEDASPLKLDDPSPSSLVQIIPVLGSARIAPTSSAMRTVREHAPM